jgi:NAD(P)H-flavin reductase
MRAQPFRVARVRRETHDAVSLFLRPEDERPATGAPGQFSMLYAFGVGEVPISLSGVARSDGAVMHTLRAVGPVSEALCRSKRGSAVGVRGPFGTSWPLEEAAGKDVVIVGGGIGLAPLRPSVEALVAQRSRYGRIAVLYGARTPDDLLFEAELRRWRASFDLDVEVTVDSAGAGWRGNVGVVPALIARATFDPANAIAFICGPPVMMRFAVTALEDAGLPRERVYISMERNMKCAVGFCGHCQFGPAFICKDGPVFRYDRIAPFLAIREL